jgi:hypothetical protein
VTTRIQPWTEPELMDREHVFEALVEKALHKTMRALAVKGVEDVLTAAATLPVDPTTEGAYATVQGAVMAEWTAQVNATLYPFLTTTFTDSAARVVDGVATASGVVVDQLTGTYADEVLQYAYNRMVGIGEALWLSIRDQLVEGYNAGESIAQIAERLTQVAGLTAPRANTVARTEIISAANNGSYLQMLDAGFDTAVTKVWLATEDTRTRLSHRHADNQGVELTGEFSVDIYSGDVKTGEEAMEFPGDPSATPGNIINCRCSLAFDFEEDEDEVLTAAKKFVEIQHPRDNDGKFKKKGTGDKYFKIPDVSDKPGNEAPLGDKVSWMVAHKWQSMLASQKSVLIQSIDEPTWQKLPPELKEKVLNAPSTTSHPVGKQSLEDALKKIQGFQDEADDDADTDAAPAGAGARPVGGVDTKTGKPLVPGKPTKLRVQLLYNTTFADGAIMAVRKDSGERVVWDEKAKKIKRQKLSTEGKYETTEALSRGAAYAAWKDEDGWTIPDASDAAPAKTQAATPSTPQVAVGKPVKLKVQLIYQTPFDDGDIVAVNPTTGEMIHWDAKKKRMVVTSELGTTEYTRGALYKEFKDSDGWHLPADKKAALAAPAKKNVPPAKSAKPAIKKAVPAKEPFQTLKVLGGENTDKIKAALTDPYVTNGTVLFEQDLMGQHSIITKTADGEASVVVNNGDTEIVNAAGLDTMMLIKAINKSKKSGQAKDAALVETGTDVSDYVASDDSNAIYQAWDTGMPGEIWGNGPFSVGLAKNGNLLFLDSTPKGGVGIVKSADVNSENIDKALEAVMAGKSWTVYDAIPDVDPDEISAPGGSQNVSAGQDPSLLQFGDGEVDDFKDILQESDTFVGDTVFENDAIKLYKEDSDNTLGVMLKSNGQTAYIDWDDIDSDHLHDKIELLQDDTSAPAVLDAPAKGDFPDFMVDIIKNQADAASVAPLSSIFDDGSVEIIKGGNGNVGVMQKGGGGLIGLGPNDITKEGLEQAYKDAMAGKVAGPKAATAVTPDKAANMKKWAQDSSTADGEEFHNGADFKIYKAASGTIVIYAKDSNGDIVPGGGKLLFGAEITADGIQNALNDLGVGAPAVPAAVSSQGQDVVNAFLNAPVGSYTLLLDEPNLKVYKSISGRMVIKNGSEDTVGILSGKDVTPENVTKGIAAVQAGYDFAPGDEIPDVSLLSPAPGVPAATPVAAPVVDLSPVGNIPTPSSLKDTGQTVGTHGGKLYKDDAGNTWLFKPTSTSQKHLALAEVAAGKLHEKAGLVTPEMGEITVDGKYGMIQKIIPNTTSPYAGSFNAKTVTQAQALQLQKEHVFDWLVSNHDSNGSNILKDADGNLIGIDKGQAFKFFGADTLDPTFNPNGHAVPITNQLFQQYIKSPLSVDINNKNQLNGFINKLQAIPDDEFRAILRPYAEAAAKNGTLAKGGPSYLGLSSVPFPANDVEAFLDAAVARKNSLDATFTEFYKKLDDAADGQSVNWKIKAAPTAPSPINPPTVTTPTIKQKPLKLSASVLTGKTSQGYFDGQVIAEHPSVNERLVWNAKTKKYDIQVQTASGTWLTAYSYNKSAALANLKDDPGWMTPSTPQVANSGTSAGDPSLAPSINGAPQVHQLPVKTAAPTATAVPKPKISVADLQAQADLSTVILPGSTKTSIWSSFRTKGVGGTSTVTLSSEPKDIFEGLLIAQAMHNKANPNAKLSLLQVLRLADVVGTEKSMSSVNQNLYEKKIVNWLQTPDGLKAAQDISDKVSVAGVGVSVIDNYNKTLEKFKEHHAKSLTPSVGWKAAMASLPPFQVKAHTPGQTYPEVTTVSQGNQFGADMLSKYGPIPSASKSALREYTGNSYHAFNSYMRSFGKSSTHMSTKAKEAAAGLRPSPRALTVHRNSDTVFDSDWMPNVSQIKDFEGVVFTEDAFVSTSNDGHTFNGKKYRFIIEVPEGTPIAWVDEFSMNKGESEFILGPGLKYEILEVTGAGTGTGASTAHKTAVIRMRVVP